MTINLPQPSAAPQSATSRSARWITVSIVIIVTAGAIAGWVRSTGSSEPIATPRVALTDTTARAPVGTHIRVRVLNATTSRGLAKRVTFVLRDFGYDVVDFDTDRRGPRTSTLVLSHTGHQEWAQRLRRALGTGSIEARADSLRYVDFTVLVGSDWKPPTQAFRP
ncbi:MAG: LytR C-terminal domain-containing protein [Gemmatimonas sp.]